MNKHTPAPWKIDSQDRGVIIDSKSRDIAAMSIHAAMKNRSIESLDEKILEANAHLMAAAPELLAACEYVVRWHREHDSGEGELFGLDFVTDCISAIAKARGKR